MGAKKALIAMSGGVDSSVAAFLTKSAGFECAGATMKLHDCGKACGAADDAADAKSVCDRLGIPHFVLDFKDDFKCRVIDKFISSYKCGATPNPCVDCNRHLKFGSLLNWAEQRGYDFVVTGHYARAEFEGGRFLLKKAADAAKDQSYVLWSLTQEQLAHVLFPLGAMTKTEVRTVAEQNGFVNAHKKESQDICFVPDGDYAAVIENYTGTKFPEGNFVTRDGKILGRHRGIIRYTIGQRRGLGLALPEPMYVCEKRVNTNEVVLCADSELYSRELTADGFNPIAFGTPPEKFKAKAKIRYNQTEQPAGVEVLSGGRVRVVFDEPQRAIAGGQSVVLYDGDTVLGGATILDLAEVRA